MQLNGHGEEALNGQDDLTFVIVSGGWFDGGVIGERITRKEYLPLTHKAFLAAKKKPADSKAEEERPKQGMHQAAVGATEFPSTSNPQEPKSLREILDEAMAEQERQGLRGHFDTNKPAFKRWGRGVRDLTS